MRQIHWRRACFKQRMALTLFVTKLNWTKVKSRITEYLTLRRWQSWLNSRKLSTISSIFNRTIRCPPVLSFYQRPRACSPTLCRSVCRAAELRKKRRRIRQSLIRCLQMSTCWIVSGSIFYFYPTCPITHLKNTTVWVMSAKRTRKNCSWKKDKKKLRKRKQAEKTARCRQTNTHSTTGLCSADSWQLARAPS